MGDLNKDDSYAFLNRVYRPLSWVIWFSTIILVGLMLMDVSNGVMLYNDGKIAQGKITYVMGDDMATATDKSPLSERSSVQGRNAEVSFGGHIAQVFSSKKLSIGDVVSIYYSKSDPAIAILRDEPFASPVEIFFVPIVPSALGLVAASIFLIRRRRRVKQGLPLDKIDRTICSLR